MTVTNIATGSTFMLSDTLNKKLEKPILQSEMGLDDQATGAGQAVRYEEFSLRHNNTGTIKQQMYNKSGATNPNSVVDTYGSSITSLLPAGYTALVPLGLSIVFGGTFGSETVTAQITVTFSDSTTATLTKTAIAVGTTTLGIADFMALVKDGVAIASISFSSKSSIASSTATVTFNRYGMYC